MLEDRDEDECVDCYHGVTMHAGGGPCTVPGCGCGEFMPAEDSFEEEDDGD